MKNYVIGIAGTKNAGKDTVASMINYIFAVGVTRASFSDYLISKINITTKYSDRIIHFADPLKDVLSIIYNIPRECFDDRLYKDELWYNLRNNKFVEEKHIIKDCSILIRIEDLKYYDISSYFNNCVDSINLYIKLRTLLQYFGTNVCRNCLQGDIWVKSALAKIIDKASERTLCVVPDIRFENEAKAIQKKEQLFYGGVILVKRDNSEQTEHPSEDINFDCDFQINNNSSLTNLFYKVLSICQQII